MPENPQQHLAERMRGIRELIEQGQFVPALDAALKLLPQVPDNRDLLYMVAICQRYLGGITEALATLAELERHHPEYGRLFQERGFCYMAVGQVRPAIDALRRAISLNMSLPSSWQALQQLYAAAGNGDAAADAARHAADLAALPSEIVAAISMFADNEIDDAERVVRRYLLTHGDHVEGMRLLAQIGMRLDVLDDAEFLLENVVRLAPDYRDARFDYAISLLQRHKHVRARQEMEVLLRSDPENRVYRTTHATICTGFGDYAKALPLYREILAEEPRNAELHLSIGHALKTLGRTSEAIDSYRAAAAVRSNYGDAYWSLANLKTYRFTDAQIALMRTEEASSGISLIDRFHLCFALGKALEDRAEYAISFEFYQRGNALKRSTSRYRPDPLERNARLQCEICTREFFESRKRFGSSDRAPIFIVGLPRAGSTLIEQILASHSQVEGTMELADIPRLVQELQGREAVIGDPRYPRVLAELDAEDFRRFGEKYLTDTLLYRTGKPRFIDKMPNNFRHLGLIHLILPNAKVIDARREPIACCFSNFKQLFASGQQFTYSFDDIARYYRMYIALMTHWDVALPGKVLRVQHEAVVDDLESNVRRILEFCELDFEQGCVDFHKTERAVHTASSEQVRRPITRAGLDQWRHYEPWLGPLKEALASGADPAEMPR